MTARAYYNEIDPYVRKEVIGDCTLYLGDCRHVVPIVLGVDAIISDPPYFKISKERWDRQWRTPAAFLDFLASVSSDWSRVLAPNGSISIFASPAMAGRVERILSGDFDILNHVIWNKLADYKPGDPRATAFRARDRKAFRRFFDYSERVIFAEAKGASRISPIGSVLGQARARAGLKGTDIDVALGYVRSKDPSKGTEIFRRWEEGRSIPSAEDFCAALKFCGDDRSRLDVLEQYELLLAETEGQRRFFSAADGPHTDVWTFETVHPEVAAHPCEKPLDLMGHLISCTVRPGGHVLDSFMGSGSTGVACALLGRRFTGVEIDPAYFDIACRRIEDVYRKAGNVVSPCATAITTSGGEQ